MLVAYLPYRPSDCDQSIIAERKNLLIELCAKEEYEANSYGWINQSEGIVRIPIERAMQLTISTINNQSLLDSIR